MKRASIIFVLVAGSILVGCDRSGKSNPVGFSSPAAPNPIQSTINLNQMIQFVRTSGAVDSVGIQGTLSYVLVQRDIENPELQNATHSYSVQIQIAAVLRFSSPDLGTGSWTLNQQSSDEEFVLTEGSTLENAFPISGAPESAQLTVRLQHNGGASSTSPLAVESIFVKPL